MLYCIVRWDTQMESQAHIRTIKSAKNLQIHINICIPQRWANQNLQRWENTIHKFLSGGYCLFHLICQGCISEDNMTRFELRRSKLSCTLGSSKELLKIPMIGTHFQKHWLNWSEMVQRHWYWFLKASWGIVL